MAKTLSVDNNNDIFIDNSGNLSISVDQDALLQACAQAAKTQLGEMVLATNQGVPNFQTIWAGSPNVVQYESALRNAITSVTGVIDILSLDISVSNNVLSYTATIQTIYGTGAINGGL
jgi:hypothetical protein